MKPFELTTALCANLGFECVAIETTSQAKAWSSLEGSLRRGQPVGLQLDCYHLEYFSKPVHFAGHFVAAYGFDEAELLLVDTAQQGTTRRASRAGVEAGRFAKGPMAAKARSWTIAPPQRPKDIGPSYANRSAPTRAPIYRRLSREPPISASASSPLRCPLVRRSPKIPPADLSLAALAHGEEPAPAGRCSGISSAISCSRRASISPRSPALARARTRLRRDPQPNGAAVAALIESAARRAGMRRTSPDAAQRCLRIADIEVEGMRALAALVTQISTAVRRVEPARLRRSAGARVRVARRGRRARARARRRILGPLEVAYRACLESRVGVARVPGGRALQRTDRRHVSTKPRAPSTGASTSIPSRTLACDFSGKHPEITHTRFGALRLKDAICDQLRDSDGRATGHRHRSPRRARARACQRSEGHGVHRPVGRRAAPSRLSHAGRRSAAAREPRRGHPAARGLAREVAARFGIPRPDVRLGHARHRSRDDRRGHRAGRAAAIISVSSAGPGTTARTWERVKRRGPRARTQADAHGCAASIRTHACSTAARENAARAGLAGAITFARGELSAARPAGRRRRRGFLATNPPYGVRLEDTRLRRAR